MDEVKEQPGEFQNAPSSIENTQCIKKPHAYFYSKFPLDADGITGAQPDLWLLWEFELR